MAYQVKHEQHEIFFLEFDNKEEFKKWEDMGSCVDDATIIRSKINTSTDELDEELDQ